MKLEFMPDTIPEGIREELDFDGYLARFDLKLPLLAHRFIGPLDGKEGRAHYKALSRLDRCLEQKKLDLEKIINIIEELPDIRFLLPRLAEGTLQQPHLFELARFVSGEVNLAALERAGRPATGYHPEASHQADEVVHLLQTAMSDNFSELRLNEDEQVCLGTLEGVQAEISQALLTYEGEILRQTGIKMIYPYPKEAVPPIVNREQLAACPLIRVSENDAVIRIDYCLPAAVKALLAKRDTLEQSFEAVMHAKLALLNSKLRPFYTFLEARLEARRAAAYRYALLWVKSKQGLCWPKFHSSIGISVDAASLPVLKQQQGRAYIPLSLDLTQGASVLFGANMSGKTTVLKTLYFHIMLIRCGLPVPARAVRLHFPADVALHLKSSGHLQSGLSGFGLEMAFLSRRFKKGALIFADELLQSTDPENGGYLAQLFLKHFAQSRSLFLCTSHYPQTTRLKDVAVFKMGSPKSAVRQSGKALSAAETTSTYNPEPLKRPAKADIARELKKPLRMALQFGLPEAVRKAVRNRLKGI